MKKYLIVLNTSLIYWLITCNMLHAQMIKGRITGANGHPVNNATLFIKELKQGTAANNEGDYELKVEAGIYTCVFQCLGYETENRVITVGTGNNIHNIILFEKAYEIREVVISNKREDPAYGIMRRAIAMAPYYLNQVSEYKADVYLKGSFHLIKLSALVRRLAKDDLEDIREGSTYVEESFSGIEFAAPNKYRQNVLKKTGSMPDSESGSAMQFITTSVYDPKAFLEMIISPLSTIAFSHYRFRYEGFIEEGNRIINKIKITPSHKGRQLLSGYIYIVDNFWNVHSIDVSGEFMMGINFRTQVNFGEVSENIWMPISHRMDFDGSILGNKGAYQYVSSVKYNQITENTSIHKPDALLFAEQQRKAMQPSQYVPVSFTEKAEPKSRTSARIETIMEKEKITNREAYQLARLMQKEAEAKKTENKSLDLTETFRNDYKTIIDSAANKSDTAFWEMMRPVPLNPDEMRSYQEKETKLSAPSQPKDTTKTNHSSKPKSQFIRATGKVLWGTNIQAGKKCGTLEYRGLKPSQFGFNTVNGFYVGQKVTWNKNFSPKQGIRLSVAPEAVWAINRKTVMWDVNATLSYAPGQRGYANLRFGQTTSDFSNLRSVHPFENSVSSLFFRYNYLKLYGNNFVEANNTIDIANGLQLTTHVKYARRFMLDNISDYSFFFSDLREYTSNIPLNAGMEIQNPNDAAHNEVKPGTGATFMLHLNYTPRYFYRIDGKNQKRMIRSNFPAFSATWQKGAGSDSNFDHLALGIRQDIETGLMQKFCYNVRGGAFVSRKSVPFPDFRHFNTVEIPVTLGFISQHSTGGERNQSSFCLLEYYRYSTSDKYFEAHLYYETPFLLLKFLPYFRNRMLWQEGIQFNYLYTNEIENYTELGYTIGIGIQAGVFAGFENFRYRNFGVKLSIPVGMNF